MIEAAVVIATRDRAEALRACLAGLAAQVSCDFEVVVVDDGSRDATPSVLDAAAGTLPALRVRRHERSRGANPARNAGVGATTAPIIVFIDDDAVPAPTWIEQLLRPFDEPPVGAVAGLVLDAPPRNVFELAVQGCHRVHRRRDGQAARINSGNLAVRRSILAAHPLDEDRAGPDAGSAVSGRGDEEGLYRVLLAEGWRIAYAADAVVVHDHPFTARTFVRQSVRGGRSAARLVWKYRLPPRLDLLPLLAAWVMLPLVPLGMPWALGPAGAAGAAVAGWTWNELARKRKRPNEALRCAPVLVLHYHLRLAGYLWQAARLRLGIDRISRGIPGAAEAAR